MRRIEEGTGKENETKEKGKENEENMEEKNLN